jgi:hypothetical protein
LVKENKMEKVNKWNRNVCECCGAIHYHEERFNNTHDFGGTEYFFSHNPKVTEEKVQERLDDGWVEIEIDPRLCRREGTRCVIPPKKHMTTKK